jgi:hypothetical protein
MALPGCEPFLMPYLIQIDAYDPVPASAVTLYASSVDDDRVCHLNGQTWRPAIDKLPTLRQDRFDGNFAGNIEAPSSEITLAIEPWPDLARYSFTDARFQLWSGNAGDAWGSWTKRFDGRVSAQPNIADGLARIAFAVDDRWLDGALLDTYEGTTGAEGSASQEGIAKPLALGRPRFVPGVLIDQTNTVTQLSNGLIEDVEVAFEKLSRFSASIGDYASYAALVAASIPPGRWATAKAVGMVRHGAPFNGKAAYHVKGDKSGPDGWARLPGEIIRRLAWLSGGSLKLDDSSLDALDVARPWNISLYLDQQTTAREQIQRVAASVNAVANVNFLGKLFASPVDAGLLSSPILTLAADGSALPAVASVEQVPMGVPWWKLGIEAERAWSPYALSEVAFTGELVMRGEYDAGTTYREGDIVYQPADGREYLYINPTPTSGNAPPNGSYWSQYRDQVDWSVISGIPYDQIVTNSDAAALNLNASFEAWTGSYPDQWSNTAGAAPVKETTIVRLGNNAAKWTVASGNAGMQIDRSWPTAPPALGTFIAGSVDIYLSARTSGLPGLIIRLYTNSALTTYVDTMVQPSNTATGAWNRIPWSARVGVGQKIYGFTMYVMASSSALPSGAFVGTAIFDTVDLAFFDSSTDNTSVTLAADGSLLGGGGGAVTITGLGYNGDLAATRNEDGANMLEDPLKMRTWSQGNPVAIREDAGGTAGAGTPRDNYRIRLDDNNAFAWLQDRLIPVVPGEKLFSKMVVHRQAAAGSLTAMFGFWYFDAAGNFLGGQATGSYAADPTADTWVELTGSFIVPTCSFIRPYFQRYGGGDAGSVFFAEPFIGRAQPGSDVTGQNTAANTSAVGGTSSGTVEAGTTAANNAANSDGTIKDDRVGTNAIQADAISERTFSFTGSSFTLTTSNQLAIDITLSAAVAGEPQQFIGKLDGNDTSYEGDFTTVNITVYRCDTGGSIQSTIVNDRSIGSFSDENATQGFSAPINFIDTPDATYRRYLIYARQVDNSNSVLQTTSYVMSGAMKR